MSLREIDSNVVIERHHSRGESRRPIPPRLFPAVQTILASQGNSAIEAACGAAFMCYRCILLTFSGVAEIGAGLLESLTVNATLESTAVGPVPRWA